MGILDKLERTLGKIWKWIGRKIKKVKLPFRNEIEEPEEQIPEEWARSKRVTTVSSKTGSEQEFVVIKKRKRKFRISWLRQTKRVLAAITLAINFLFAEFILGSQSAFQWLSILFFLNSFFLIDYLWKTRRKPE